MRTDHCVYAQITEKESVVFNEQRNQPMGLTVIFVVNSCSDKLKEKEINLQKMDLCPTSKKR